MFDTVGVSEILIGVLILCGSCSYWVYRYSIRNHDYWKKRGIRQAKTAPFLGSIYEVFKSHFHVVELRRYQKLGALYGHYEASKPALSVGDPNLIKDILVKDFHLFMNRREFTTDDKVLDNMLAGVQGDHWKRLRTIVSPTFSTGKIKRVTEIFKICAQTVVDNFKSALKSKEPVDAKRIYGAYTMDVIASFAFSTKLDSHNDPDNEFVLNAKKVFNQSFSWKILLSFIFPGIFKTSFFPMEAVSFFNEVTLQIVKERKKPGQVRNDFLQLLLDIAKEESPNQVEESAESQIHLEGGGMNAHVLKSVISKQLSRDELVAQCITFFLAGYETTASTLAFTSYCLALNPDEQDKLRAEVDEAFKDTHGELTYENVQNLKYLDNVISESLRLYPPAVRIERTAGEDYKLGDTGITLEKGMLVTIPAYAIHRDSNYFKDPELFDPDRFTPEEKAKRNPYTYLPFGAGPRNCVGMRFALVEIKVCLAYVIRNFILKRSSRTKVPLELKTGQGLLQPGEILLDLEIRDDI